MSIPFELISFAVSAVFGGFMSMWSKSLDAKADRERAMISALGAEDKSRQAARKWANPGFAWTRRFITLAAIAAIIVWPMVVPVFWPEVHVTYGWLEFKPGFLFLPDKESMVWHTITDGIVLTPLHTNLMSAIVGLYFGGSMGQRRL